MKSTMDKKSGLARKLNIEVPAARVQSAFEKVYKGIQKNATIKGFRKGKAPLSAIRSMYGDRVKQDVLNDLISESYQSALDQHKLEPVGYPKIHFEDFVEDGAFIFTAELEVRPEVEIRTFEGLKVERERLEIDEKQVDAVLENIRQSQSSLTPVLEDRGVQNGDIVEIDFSGFVNGAPLEHGSAENRHLEIGSNQFIAGFEDGLIGMKPGERRELNLRFPDEYHNSEVAGSPVQFKVNLKMIKRRDLPEMNDEFAAKNGPFKTIEDLKQAIRDDIKESEVKRIQDELRSQTLRALVKANPVEVPESLKQQQKELIVRDVQERMKQQGLAEVDFEEYKKKWDSDFNDTASFMVQSTFLVDALADKLKLRAQGKDVDSKIDEYAKQTGIDRQKVAEFYGQPERRSRLAFQITEELVVKYLIDKADVKEVDPKPKG